ncbi:MAG TPA: hypothetical protein VM103_01515 [Candidatus Paceibacterota bacterium]|nr:hypothetical protein [Candidatus Paceibacterota bacterium]
MDLLLFLAGPELICPNSQPDFGLGCLNTLLVLEFIIIPLLFGIAGFMAAKESPFKQAVIAFGVSVAAVLVFIFIVIVWPKKETHTVTQPSFPDTPHPRTE